MSHHLHALFHPQSLAVVGASDRYGSTGREVFSLLSAGCAAGTVVPVNNRHKTVGGVKAFDTLADACKAHACDSAVVILSADKLNAVVREAAKCKVGNVVFVHEPDAPPNVRSKLDRAAETARKAGIALLAVPVSGLGGLFRASADAPACVYVGQSADIADCVRHYAADRRIVFSRFLTLNPQNYPVGTGEIIDYAAWEASTSALLVHICTLDDAQALVSALTAAARHKPVVVLPTLSDPAEARVFARALSRRHILTVGTLTEFLIAAKLIHTGRTGRGKRVAVLGNTPHIARLSVQTLAQTPLEAAAPVRAAARLLPHKTAPANPLNLPADTPPPVLAAAAEACLQDEHNDAVLLMYNGRHADDGLHAARLVSALQSRFRKPLLLAWLGSADTPAVRQLFCARKILHFRQPEHALHALSQLQRYRLHQQQRHRSSPFYDYRAAAEAALVPHKHWRSLLPVAVLPLPATKTQTAHLLAALKLHKQTGSKPAVPPQLKLQWEKHPRFGRILQLANAAGQTAELLPPPAPEAVAGCLRELSLPEMIWGDWLLDTLEILCRLPEIHSLTLELHHDVRHGIACTEAKPNLQDPDRAAAVADIFAPYPADAEETLLLPDTPPLHLRPLRPEDAALIARLAAAQSEESRYRRFMTRLPVLPAALLARLCRPDYRREFALLLHDDAHTPLATAGYSADACLHTCEFGISVADTLQGKGIGKLLMQRLINRARAHGYRHMRAEILGDNHAMHKLALALGFTVRPHPEDARMLTATLALHPSEHDS
ncbi:GNAT family N-acetyltransferase [Conchiformibius kuhniae]|uniref:GNAT family N-acetyltransferase n=1 Tax=Conchiformibius kuhniae TaxID=211502 RepID=A0ABD8B896_9NEIS|nr:GNAT family N-acetyltransferase [Conchiformibius kuhniae]